MEVDTGATLSIIREETYHRLWAKDNPPPSPLRLSIARLKIYIGEALPEKGALDVVMVYWVHPNVCLLNTWATTSLMQVSSWSMSLSQGPGTGERETI
jgi:hypothetical protein